MRRCGGRHPGKDRLPSAASARQALPAVCADADGSGLANPYHNPGHSLEAGVDWFCLALLNNAMVGGVAAVLERQARQQGARAETCRE